MSGDLRSDQSFRLIHAMPVFWPLPPKLKPCTVKIDFTAGSLHEVLLDRLDCLHRALLGRADRRNHLRQHPALVFLGQECARQAQEQHDHQCGHRAEGGHESPATREHSADPVAVPRVAAVERPVEPAEKAAGRGMRLGVSRLQQRCAQGWRQHQRDQHRERHGRDDGRRELAVDDAGGAGEERHRDEHGRQHEADADQRARDLVHRLAGGLDRRQALVAHDALDVLDDHDRVVDEQADGQHHREHRQHVDRVAERRQHRERAEQDHRHRDRRDQRGAEVLQEQVHHEEHERDGLEQRQDHALDRNAHERRRVEGDDGLESGRERELELLQRGLDRARGLYRVGARRERDGDSARGLAVVAAHEAVVRGAEFDARHVAEQQRRAVRVAAQHDGPELLRLLQAALGGDRGIELLPGDRRRASELADRDLLVLCPDLGDHVVGREAVGLELAGIEPDAHRVLRAECLHVADAGDARDRVDDVRGDEVGDVVLTHAAVFGDEADHHQEPGAALADVDALQLHDLRQQRRDELQLVLHLHLRDVGIRAALERERDRRLAARLAGRGHVDAGRRAPSCPAR